MFDTVLAHNALGTPLDPKFVPKPVMNRLSRPVPGRSLGATVVRVEHPIREAIEHLSRATAVDENAFNSVFDCTKYGPGFVKESDGLRLSWFLVTVAIAQALVAKRNQVGPFLPALEWFLGETQLARKLLACVPRQHIESAEEELKSLAANEELHDLLPYVLEPHGHVSRNSLETCNKAKSKRDTKRDSGVYYTPSDVAEFMVSALADLSGGGGGSWIDPACGTGVFLRAVIAHQRNLETHASGRNLREFALSSVYGIDRSAIATDLAAFVVFIECFWHHSAEEHPFHFWQQIKKNIVCMDALRMTPEQVATGPQHTYSKATHVQEFFPAIGSKGFDHVVMNPPYAMTRVDKFLHSIWRSYADIAEDKSGDTHLAFTEMLYRLTSSHGVSAAVLPLSIGTNTTRAYLRVRKALLDSAGTKEFLFFDREPQALFGEDIKTRNLILIWQGSSVAQGVKTSRLLKWTAEQRTSIFSRDRLVDIAPSQCTAFIPKVGTRSEILAYNHLRSACVQENAVRFSPQSSRLTLGEAVSADDTDRRNILLVSSTAYNFINCFHPDALPIEPPRPYSSSPINALLFRSEMDAYAAFALVSSRLCFWLWHIEGDGFHVTNSFLKRLPLWSAWSSELVKQRVAEQGKRLWLAASDDMVGAVNGGKQTYSFHCGYDHPSAIDVEQELLRHLGLDEKFSDSLDAFIEATVSIDGKQRLRRAVSNLRK